MKNIGLFILFSILLFLFSNVNAQSTQINWGEEFELEKKNRLVRLAGMDNENYYLISGRRKKSNYELLTFRILDHTLINTQPLDFEYDKAKYTFLETVHTSAGIFVYYFQDNEAANKIELYVAKINQGKLGGFELVHEQEKEKDLFSNHIFSSQAATKGKGYKINVKQKNSSNGKFVTLSYRQEIKDKFKDFQLLCLNQDMKVVWEKKIDFEEEKKRIVLGGFRVNDNGTVYCLTRVHKSKLTEVVFNKLLFGDYFFRIYKIDKANVESFDFLFDEDLGYYPANVELILPVDERLTLTGMYAAEKDGSEIKGSFYATINNLDDHPEVKLHPFKNISLMSRKFRDQWDKLDAPKPNYSLINSQKFENGNRVLLLENYVVKYNSEGKKIYYTDEILLFLFDKAGELLTDTIVKKQLWVGGKSLSSFAGILGNKNLYLVYNHSMRRKERKANGVKGMPTSMTVFNDQGEITTEILFSTGIKAYVADFYPKYVDRNKTHFLLGKFMRGKFTFGTIPIE